MAKKDNKKGTKKVTETKKKGTNTTTKNTTTKKEQVKKTTPVKEEKKVVTKVEEKVKKEEVKAPEVKPVEKKEEKQPKKCNKKLVYICGVVVLAIILVIIILFMLKNNNKNKIEKSISSMGEQFYTEYYYPQITKNKSKKEIKELLSKFEKNGIKINLKNLAVFKGGKFKKEIDTFKNKDKECDKNSSKVIIRPAKPYGKNDYKIEIKLDCGF